jgi:nucleoside-diphosphate-sugar epimerase
LFFSTGCVYELRSADSDGSRESDTPRPIGEYANSCLGRERVFQYHSEKYNTPILIYRLNYSIDLRYGVLMDIAGEVYNGNPVDLSVGVVNIIWQGDAVNRALLCLEHTACPAKFLNVTGPETISVKDLAEKFGENFDKHVKYKNEDRGKAYLSDAENSIKLFGPPTVSPEYMIKWVSDWILKGGQHLDKPTHFQVTDGQFLD